MRKYIFYFSLLIGVLFFGCDKEGVEPDKPVPPEPSKPVEVSSIEVEDTELTMKPGDKTTISYTVLPSDASNKEVDITVSDSEVASLKGKELTAIKVGKAVITIKSKSNSVSAKISVEVVPLSTAEVTLNKSELNLVVGDKETLVATITPEDADNKELIWKSSNPSVATVSSSGEIEALAQGETEISVSTKDGKVSAKAKVTVSAKVVEVESVVLKPADATMSVGSTATVTATVLPANATDKTLTWSSSEPSVVSVNAGGILTALKAGTAVITATTRNGKVSGKMNVTVSPQAIPVESVTLKPTDISMVVESTITITATVLPTNASHKTLTWTSSVPSVASVDSKGLVKALKVGTAVISATTKDGKVSGEATVTVSARIIPVESVTLMPTDISMLVESTTTITATVLPTNASHKTLTWTSSTPSVASVDSKGVVKGLKAGTAVITATTKDGKVSGKATVTVSAKIVPVESITLKPADISLDVDDNTTVTASILPANATDKSITWTSSAPEIASVDSKGLVKALKVGTAVITATSKDGKVSGKTTVTVSPKTIAVESVTLKPTDISMVTESTTTITATVLPTNASHKTLTWTSSAPSVASVDSKGVVKGLKAGTAVITATTKDGKVSGKATVTVSAKTVPVESITLKPADISLDVDDNTTVTASILPANATDKSITWTSSAPEIASVDSKGLVKALKVGTAVITATSKDGKVSGKTTVTVSPKTIAVESVTLKPTDISMVTESTTTITATVLPTNASHKTLTWTSSAPSVASVDSKGVVKGLKAGTAVITATTKDGKVSGKATVTVSAKIVPVESISLVNEDKMLVGSTLTISATVLPENASDKTLSWTSSAPSVASVDSRGIVTAHKVGSAVITATAKGGKVTAKTTIAVQPVLASSIHFDRTNISMAIGSATTISTQISPANTTDKTLVWESSAPSIVSVDRNGLIKALAAGSAVITAKSKEGSAQNSVRVEVKEDISYVTGNLSFSLVSAQFTTIGMQVYMSNASNRTISIKKVEAYTNGKLAATALSDFTETVGPNSNEQSIIGFTQRIFSSNIGNYPPNWHAKVYFVMNGMNYAMTIKNTGSSIQRLQQSSIGINPVWDGENTTEIP